MSGHLQDLKEIKDIMQRSTRFISLSGLSGVFAGIYALVGAFVAHLYFKNYAQGYILGTMNSTLRHYGYKNVVLFCLLDACLVLGLALITSFLLTYRNAIKNKEKVFSATSVRMAINILVPLAVGGIFCLILIYYGLLALVAPSTLVFYGMALINGSNFTLRDIRYLGYLEIIVGLVAMLDIGHGLMYWSIGFGLLHIIYGTFMYLKYEKR